MKLLSRLFIGFLYSTPFLIIHMVIIVLLFKDPHTLEVLKRVGYGALGVYASLILAVVAFIMIATLLMSLRYLFGLRVQTKNTDK